MPDTGATGVASTDWRHREIRKMTKHPYRMLTLGLLLSPATTTLAATAQIEEVVVTAQKRSESAQEIPIAINAYGSDALEMKGANDISGLATTVPALTFAPYPSSSGALILFMRGQGANDVGQITKEGAIGMYIDGVYMARPQSSSMDLADIERIEVLRGPQGTLYGRNTTGGAINIHTRKPSGEFAFKEQLTIGNQGRLRSLTTIDLPAVGDVSAKLSYVRSSKDGYVRNRGGNDYGEQDQQGARLALRWDISDTLSADYAFEIGDSEDTPIYYQNDLLAGPNYPTSPHTKTPRRANLPTSTTDFSGHSLTLSWDLSENVSVKSISSYRELDTRYFQDYLDAAFVAGYYETDDSIDSHQWSQEFQIVGSALDARLEYVAGVYYFEEKANHRQRIWLQDLQDDFDPGNNFPAPHDMLYDRYVNADTNSQAVYSQVSYTPMILEDRLTLTAGLRYTEDERDGIRDYQATILNFNTVVPIENGTRNAVSYSSTDPMLSANYQLTDDASVYAKVVTAYKSGGFAESSGDFTIDYNPEEITSYELGLKSYWLDRRLRVNVAAFSSDYEEMQLDLSPDPAQIAVVNTYNAGTAEVSGLELDILAQLTAQLSVSLDYAYLDWSIDEVNHPVSGQDISEQFVLPYAPENAYTASLDYQFGESSLGDFWLNLSYSWQDSHYATAGTGASAQQKALWEIDSYGLLNARLTLTAAAVKTGELRLALWGKNIQDKDYVSHRFTAGAGSTIAYNEPRSFGLDIIYEF